MCANLPRVTITNPRDTLRRLLERGSPVCIICLVPRVLFFHPRYRPFPRVNMITPRETCQHGFSMVPHIEYPLGVPSDPKETIWSLGFSMCTLGNLYVPRVSDLALGKHSSPRDIFRF